MVRFAFAVVALAAATGPALAASPVTTGPAPILIPHRAVYDLTLKEASERSGIAGMYGRMVYEFTGGPCAGYTTNFRFVTEIDTGEERKMSDQQTTTFEDIGKGKFRFSSKSFTDEQLDKEVSGEAEERKDKLSVALERPQPRSLELAGSRFPTEHMLEIIRHAQEGKRIFESRVFDGSDNGDTSLITTAVVGDVAKPTPGEGDSQGAGRFGADPYWPVTIAYFKGTTTDDELPTYRMSFKLYANGITRDLTMDYGDFVLTGKLSRLEELKPVACP